ncbi:MAG TPA: type II secretion system F family protein [Candidatus Nanoarchaeia archaeon]|nr:type II secretion system F family protein [Candidatus Nanoarchaeia archaeon]
MIEALQKNIDAEIEILREINSYLQNDASGAEKQLIGGVVESLESKLKIINASMPQIIKNISPTRKLSEKEASSELTKVQINEKGYGKLITLQKKDREKFLGEVKVNLDLLGKLKVKEKKKEIENAQSSREYIKFSNKFFLNLSTQLIKKGYFVDLKESLGKANMEVLLSSYVSMILMSTSLAVLAGILLAITLLFFNIGLTFPFFTPYGGEIVSRIISTWWVIVALPIGTFFAMYYYPGTEKDSIEKKIDQELPFAVIHMSAISGSGIEPSEIFKIIGRSEEYVYLGKEIRKVVNQINLYGYDLVTALNNVAKTSPSAKLTEVFSGLATTINSGGQLSDFFEKRAETLLLSYRLEREKFTKVAETFMDIYISVVIAAPMILMLLLIMLQVSGNKIGFTTTQISFLIITGIAVLNVFFITFLHLKQPSY